MDLVSVLSETLPKMNAHSENTNLFFPLEKPEARKDRSQ
jgi:hypothetical protein